MTTLTIPNIKPTDNDIRAAVNVAKILIERLEGKPAPLKTAEAALADAVNRLNDLTQGILILRRDGRSSEAIGLIELLVHPGFAEALVCRLDDLAEPVIGATQPRESIIDTVNARIRSFRQSESV